MHLKQALVRFPEIKLFRTETEKRKQTVKFKLLLQSTDCEYWVWELRGNWSNMNWNKDVSISSTELQIPHIKVGMEETYVIFFLQHFPSSPSCSEIFDVSDFHNLVYRLLKTLTETGTNWSGMEYVEKRRRLWLGLSHVPCPECAPLLLSSYYSTLLLLLHSWNVNWRQKI